MLGAPLARLEVHGDPGPAGPFTVVSRKVPSASTGPDLPAPYLPPSPALSSGGFSGGFSGAFSPPSSGAFGGAGGAAPAALPRPTIRTDFTPAPDRASRAAIT